MRFRQFLSSTVQNSKLLIKGSDIFAKRIMFTYEGRHTFSTLLGGWTSIFIVVTVLVYMMMLLNIMINNKYLLNINLC